jgi:hypothetical protein
MRIILRQYLSSLRERGELEVLLPDLLSQMGLTVFSRPGIGARQYGVDVAAVGSMDGGSDKVYLFTIKAGNVTRKIWDGHSEQALRPSLDEIIDVYIPQFIPVEHKNKEIVICVCCGGDIREEAALSLRSYFGKYENEKIHFEEWNGDKLASKIESVFLREDLLPEVFRSNFRKSLAMLDEPDVSFKYFSAVIQSISASSNNKKEKVVLALRQMSLSLWILFAWARDQNLESAYLSSEFTMLQAWEIVKQYFTKDGNLPEHLKHAFFSIFETYQKVSCEFLETQVLPHVEKLHAISYAVCPSCPTDINLKLFDLLGRLALKGIWIYSTLFGINQDNEDELKIKQKLQNSIDQITKAIRHLILNNPVLYSPIKDSQAIDISIAALLLMIDKKNHGFVKEWLANILGRIAFAYEVHGPYPCILESYSDLLLHPKKEVSYRINVTKGSILYPTIALFAALLDDEETYSNVGYFKKNHLDHCTFQLWFPDVFSEEYFYTNNQTHGAVLTDVPVERPIKDFLTQIFDECKQSDHFYDLSAVKYGFEPLIFVACRHYRLPLPTNLYYSESIQEQLKNM